MSVTRQCNLPLMVHHSFSTVPLGSGGEWTLGGIYLQTKDTLHGDNKIIINSKVILFLRSSAYILYGK